MKIISAKIVLILINGLWIEGGGLAPHFFPIDEILMKNMCGAENLLEVLLKYPSATFGTKIELYGPTEHRKHCTS